MGPSAEGRDMNDIDLCESTPAPFPYYSWSLHAKWKAAREYCKLMRARRYLSANHILPSIGLGISLRNETATRCIHRERPIELKMWGRL
jgi:hypothetical protein